MKKDKENLKNSCNCNDHCTCGDNCDCNDQHRCSEDCTCNNNSKCNCGETCSCGDNCSCHENSKEAEYLELAQRIKAEFDNYKRRNADLTTQSFNNGVGTLVYKLLPAIDSFKQARTNIKDEDTLKGLDMIEGLIIKAFSELNVEKIDCVGKDFDPRYHNAVLTGNEPDKADNIVLEEYQEGFKLNDRIIRPSVVKINKLS